MSNRAQLRASGQWAARGLHVGGIGAFAFGVVGELQTQV